MLVSGSGQQHGSVYLNRSFAEVVGSLRTDESLADQLAALSESQDLADLDGQFDRGGV